MKLIETIQTDLHALRTRGLRIIVVATAALALAAFDSADANDTNLKRGAVFTMSNALEGNVVAAFSRAPDGTLTEAGRFPTGGTGSGGFEDTSNGMILGNARGESSPNNLIGAGKFLFVTNAGSNSITVFRVEKEGLEIVEVQPSGGEKPVSVTVSNGLLYVLHSGEFVDGLVPPNVFEVGRDGSLTFIQTVQAFAPSAMAARIGLAAS